MLLNTWNWKGWGEDADSGKELDPYIVQGPESLAPEEKRKLHFRCTTLALPWWKGLVFGVQPSCRVTDFNSRSETWDHSLRHSGSMAERTAGEQPSWLT